MFQIASDLVDVQSRLRFSGVESVRARVQDTKSDAKARLRDAQRVYVQDVLRKTGLKPSELARNSSMNPSTLTRFLNDNNYRGTLNPLTLTMIYDRTGIPVPENATTKPIVAKQTFREPEAEAYDPNPADPVAAAVAAFVGVREWISPWTLQSRALEYEGYRAGDVLLVDLNAQPKAGDIVCAQFYDWQRNGAETVFRLYQPPVLIGAGPDEEARKPRLIDDHNVAVKGVVVMSFRGRT